MNITDAILNRKSVRKYQQDKPVSDEILTEIVKVAEKSPSWINSQPGRVFIATGKKLDAMRTKHLDMNQNPDIHTKSAIPYVAMDKWDEAAQTNMNKKRQDDVALLGLEQIAKLYPDSGDHLFYAPAVAYLTLPKNYTPWELYDLGAFGQSIMLAAQAHGVDSNPAFEFVKYDQEVKAALGIPDDQIAAIGIGLGYEDKDAPINKINPERMPLDDVLKIVK